MMTLSPERRVTQSLDVICFFGSLPYAKRALFPPPPPPPRLPRAFRSVERCLNRLPTCDRPHSEGRHALGTHRACARPPAVPCERPRHLPLSACLPPSLAALAGSGLRHRLAPCLLQLVPVAAEVAAPALPHPLLSPRAPRGGPTTAGPPCPPLLPPVRPPLQLPVLPLLGVAPLTRLGTAATAVASLVGAGVTVTETETVTVRGTMTVRGTVRGIPLAGIGTATGAVTARGSGETGGGTPSPLHVIGTGAAAAAAAAATGVLPLPFPLSSLRGRSLALAATSSPRRRGW